MFEGMRYRLQLGKLYRGIAKIRRHYRKEIEEAKKSGKNKAEIEEIRFGESFEHLECQEDIDYLTTTFLRRKARRLMLPLPDSNDNQFWEESHWAGGYRKLTEKGITEVRSTIRKELKERRDAYLAFLPLITALAGLIGMITGLLAVILN